MAEQPVIKVQLVLNAVGKISQCVMLIHALSDNIRDARRAAMCDNIIYLPATGVKIGECRPVFFLVWKLLLPSGYTVDAVHGISGVQCFAACFEAS